MENMKPVLNKWLDIYTGNELKIFCPSHPEFMFSFCLSMAQSEKRCNPKHVWIYTDPAVKLIHFPTRVGLEADWDHLDQTLLDLYCVLTWLNNGTKDKMHCGLIKTQ